MDLASSVKLFEQQTVGQINALWKKLDETDLANSIEMKFPTWGKRYVELLRPSDDDKASLGAKYARQREFLAQFFESMGSLMGTPAWVKAEALFTRIPWGRPDMPNLERAVNGWTEGERDMKRVYNVGTIIRSIHVMLFSSKPMQKLINEVIDLHHAISLE